MRSSNTCCASGFQLVGDELLDISSVYVYVYERAVNGLDTYKNYARYKRGAAYEVFAKLPENLMMKSIIL